MSVTNTQDGESLVGPSGRRGSKFPYPSFPNHSTFLSKYVTTTTSRPPSPSRSATSAPCIAGEEPIVRRGRLSPIVPRPSVLGYHSIPYPDITHTSRSRSPSLS